MGSDVSRHKLSRTQLSTCSTLLLYSRLFPNSTPQSNRQYHSLDTEKHVVTTSATISDVSFIHVVFVQGSGVPALGTSDTLMVDRVDLESITSSVYRWSFCSDSQDQPSQNDKGSHEMVIGTKTHSITHHSLVYGRAMSATLTRDKYAEYFLCVCVCTMPMYICVELDPLRPALCVCECTMPMYICVDLDPLRPALCVCYAYVYMCGTRPAETSSVCVCAMPMYICVELDPLRPALCVCTMPMYICVDLDPLRPALCVCVLCLCIYVWNSTR
ncbi:hypothetical protein RRG08_013625 [Elysia crispata]|uniref:Uncharacterized protein n=1 Tax=Elysia crispata TaxID=231223 RepID=A0AAE0Y3C6_9GAST|nr:hypothetical protein RRG08_013625 [Elysia crispata]